MLDNSVSISASIVIYQSPLKDIKNIITKLNKSSFKIKIYIVDNYPGGSISIEDLDRDIVYIPAKKNLGYGAGHNIAIKKVYFNDGFHFVINPDIDFEYKVIERMIHKMITNPNYSLIGPSLIGLDNQYQCNTKLIPSPFDLISRRLPSFFNFLFKKCRHNFEMENYNKNNPLYVPYLSGCFMLFRNSSLRKVGLFDENFFMYPEDIDISRRFFEHGNVLYLPEFKVIHAWEGASRKSLKMFFIHFYNMIIYFNKWGWIFDNKRKELNKIASQLNKHNRKDF